MSENTKNSQPQNTFTPGLTEEYTAQVSEEIERMFIKKLSQEFRRTESRILSALSKLDEFLLSPHVRTCSIGVLGTSGNKNLENWKPTGDRSLNDLYPEVELSACRIRNPTDSDKEETLHRYKI